MKSENSLATIEYCQLYQDSEPTTSQLEGKQKKPQQEFRNLVEMLSLKKAKQNIKKVNSIELKIKQKKDSIE